MKVLVGLVLVGCGLGIVGIQVFGDPASWATTIPGDPRQLGLVAIAALALVVGGMVLTPSGAALPPTLELPEAAARPTRATAISEPLPVLSLDEDEEAARRRARRAARRKRERAAAGEAPAKTTKTAKRKRAASSDEARPTKRRREGEVAERPRTKKKPRKRELAGSGRL